MKAMVLNRPADVSAQPLSLRDCPVPVPGPGQVRIAVHACGVCRTDLHIVEGDLPPHTLPIIPGHMVIGHIDTLGDGCPHRFLQQRVGVGWLASTCGQCGFCRTGRENLCPAARFTGYDLDGGYASYLIADAGYIYTIPDQFADLQAAPLLCAGIIGYRSLQRANVPPGGTVALYGFGSAAHLILQIVRHRGCQACVVTRSRSHQHLARDLGAVWAGENPEDLPGPADAAILFAPAGPLVPPALKNLRPGGTLSLAGIHMSPIPQLDYHQHLYHERELRSTMNNTREDTRHLLAEAAQAGVQAHIQTYDLQDANRALADMKASRFDGTAVLVPV